MRSQCHYCLISRPPLSRTKCTHARPCSKKCLHPLALRGLQGTRIELCCLLVHVQFGSEPNYWPTPRQLRRRSQMLMGTSERVTG
eukprot:2808613-Prymnesium_polylepis.1